MSALVRVSCGANAALGGDPGEMLCSRAHREDWRVFCLLADAAFLLVRLEAAHCRRRREEHDAGETGGALLARRSDGGMTTG